MPIRPRGCCAISPVGLSNRRPVSLLVDPLKPWKGFPSGSLHASLALARLDRNFDLFHDGDRAPPSVANAKRWRNAAMALRWTAAGMMQAAKGLLD